eukprot:7487416-Pyramimonas_sp.AAC.1
MAEAPLTLYIAPYCYTGVVQHLGGGLYQQQCAYSIRVKVEYAHRETPLSHGTCHTPGGVAI